MALTVEQAKLGIKLIREQDPVNHFFGLHGFTRLGTDGQIEPCIHDAMYKLLTTANQGGKTTSAIFDCAALVRNKHPSKDAAPEPITILVIVPSRAQAAGIWGKRLLEKCDLRHTITNSIGVEVNLATKPLIPNDEIEKIDWSPSPMGRYPGQIKLKNGNVIYMALSGDTKSWERIQGFPIDAIYRDEAVGNKNLGAELVPRLSAAQEACRKGTRTWAGFIFWIATATLPNAEFEDYRKRCEDGVEGHQIFWLDPNENPAISAEVRDGQRLAMSTEEASVRLDGTGSAAGNLRLLPQFEKARHVLSTAEGIRPLDNIWLGYDPGWDHPFGLTALVVGPEHPTRLRLTWCHCERNKTLEYVADCIAGFLDGRVVEAFVFDPASKRTEHGRGQSMAFQMEQLLAARKVRSERGILYGRNRYEDTLPLLQRYLSPLSTLTSQEPLLVFDQPTDQNGVGRAVEQFLKYRKRHNVGEGNHPPMGAIVYKQDDDLVDPIRYIVSRMPQYCQRRAHDVDMWHHTKKLVESTADKTTILDTDDDAMKVHKARLQACQKYPDSSSHSLPSMPTGNLTW